MEQPPKRKHRATGAGRGGRREGAGRPSGTTNALGMGEVRAVKACRLRVPETATPEQAELADRALQRVIDVMEEQVPYQRATSVLGAAARIREEVCGPVKQKHEVSGPGGAPINFAVDLSEAK